MKTKNTNRYHGKLKTKNASLYDADGYLIQHNVSIIEQDDIIIIGRTAHNRDELTITKTRLESKISGYYADWS